MHPSQSFISYLALKEYLSLIPTRRIDREVLLFAYLAIPIQYYWAAIDWYGMFIVFVPVWMFLFLPPLLVLRGRSEGFLRAVGTISSGLMMTVFTLSHWHGCSCRATSSIRSLAESGSCSSLWC